MLTDTEIEELTQFAVNIAGESGEIARRYFRKTIPVENKSDKKFDPVTAADREIEKFLRARIQQSYPEHGITGEEEADRAGNACTWVIDPIDGTRGFVSGAPMWGTLLGLTEAGRRSQARSDRQQTTENRQRRTDNCLNTPAARQNGGGARRSRRR